MNSTLIRITKEDKEKIDLYMKQEIKEMFEKGDKKIVNKILRRGYSYAEFVHKLIDVYIINKGLSIKKK